MKRHEDNKKLDLRTGKPLSWESYDSYEGDGDAKA
jgi:hypothetical protein